MLYALPLGEPNLLLYHTSNIQYSEHRCNSAYYFVTISSS